MRGKLVSGHGSADLALLESLRGLTNMHCVGKPCKLFRRQIWIGFHVYNGRAAFLLGATSWPSK